MSSVMIKRVFDEGGVKFLNRQVDKVVLDEVVVDVTEKKGFFPWSGVEEVHTSRVVKGNLEDSSERLYLHQIGFIKVFPSGNMNTVHNIVSRMEKGDREFYLTPELADFIDLIWEL